MSRHSAWLVILLCACQPQQTAPLAPLTATVQTQAVPSVSAPPSAPATIPTFLPAQPQAPADASAVPAPASPLQAATLVVKAHYANGEVLLELQNPPAASFELLVDGQPLRSFAAGPYVFGWLPTAARPRFSLRYSSQAQQHELSLNPLEFQLSSVKSGGGGGSGGSGGSNGSARKPTHPKASPSPIATPTPSESTEPESEPQSSPSPTASPESSPTPSASPQSFSTRLTLRDWPAAAVELWQDDLKLQMLELSQDQSSTLALAAGRYQLRGARYGHYVLPEQELVVAADQDLDLAYGFDKHYLLHSGEDASDQATRLQSIRPSNFLQPSYVYLPPNTAVTISATAPAGSYKRLRAYVGTYSYDQDATGAILGPRNYTLTPGSSTTFSDPQGGTLWFEFSHGLNAPAQEITLDVSGGVQPLPYFELGQISRAQYHWMLAQYPDAPMAQLSSQRAIVSARPVNARLHQDADQDLLMRLYDAFIATEEAFQGLAPEEYRQSRQHYVDTNCADCYMYATHYRMGFHTVNATPYILRPEKLRDAGWGPWHETGHMNQLRPWTWSQMVEVTTNLYSLAVQRSFGQPSRLNTRSGGKTLFDRAFEYLAGSEKNFNSDTLDVFVRLVMLEQLRLAFGDGFYPQMHQLTRQEKPVVTNDADRMHYFMVLCSRVSGRNLTAFFEKWGLPIEARTRDAIALLQLPEPTIDPTSLRSDLP